MRLEPERETRSEAGARGNARILQQRAMAGLTRGSAAGAAAAELDAAVDGAVS